MIILVRHDHLNTFESTHSAYIIFEYNVIFFSNDFVNNDVTGERLLNKMVGFKTGHLKTMKL